MKKESLVGKLKTKKKDLVGYLRREQLDLPEGRRSGIFINKLNGVCRGSYQLLPFVKY